MGSSNNPTKKMNCCCHVFMMTLMSRATNDGSRICQHWQTVQDISDVNIIILIYLFIKHVLFILMYLHKCKMHVTMSVELKVYLFVWSHNFQFSMSLSLLPNSLYRQTTDCTEGGGLTREHSSCMEELILIAKIVVWRNSFW
jgi:hypothetical protein